jgi:hypothetical protein
VRRSTSLKGLLAAGLVLVFAHPALAEGPSSAKDTPTGLRTVTLPLADAGRGRTLFVAKGCFLCHAIGGTGGLAAPGLDAPADNHELDLMDFVARMWLGAAAMIELQTLELGYQIQLTGAEIADLAAFAASDEMQRDFTIDEIPEPLRDWMIDEPYWMEEAWPDDFKQEHDENGLRFDYR